MAERPGFYCKVLDLNFWTQESDFVWIKSSAHQNTLVAKFENEALSVLKIKDSGHVINFVLDPNLCCVYWDHEEASEQTQKLCAQTIDKDIIVYAVNEDGVAVHQSILYSKIKGAAKDHLTNDEELQLVGCDRGYVFLWNGCYKLLCMKMATGGYISLPYTLQLPSSTCDKMERQFRSFQIVNGSVVVFDYNAFILYIYSVVAEKCVCQINLKSLSLDPDTIRDWRIALDLSVIMFLFKDWGMLSVNILEYGQHEPESVQHLDTDCQQNFNMEYLTYHLCRYGDVTWKRQVVEHHLDSPDRQFKVVGFNVEKKKKTRKDYKPKEKSSPCFKTLLTLPDPEKNTQWTLKTMEASSNVLTMLLEKASTSLGTKRRISICFANFTNRTVQLFDVDDKTSVILSERPACSHILLSDNCLKFISPFGDLQKDELISWMVSYSGPPGADNLCLANQWTRTSVPLQTIEASLQQRQMDTLAFYLKSKKDLFRLSSHHVHGTGLGNEVRQIQDALNLVTATISANLHEPQGKIFVERLLSLSLEFIYGLLEDARQNQFANIDKEREFQEACDSLMSYIPTMRKSMAALQYKRLQSRSSSQNSESVKELVLKKIIDKLSIIEYSMKENKCSQLQAQLMSQLENPTHHYRDLVTDLLKIVQKYLENKDISGCQQILNNMGCEVSSVLWSLAKYNNSRDHQKFLTNQLSAAAALSTSQHQLVDFLEKLYQAYPFESFTLAVKSKMGNPNRKWANIQDPLIKLIKTKDAAIFSHCGEISTVVSPPDIVPPTSELYVAVNLAWVSKWSAEERKAVLIDAHFINSENVMISFTSDPETTWQFLMSHNLIDILLPFMEAIKPEESFSWPADPTQYLSSGWSHFKKEVARQLLRLKKLKLDLLLKQNVDLFELLLTIGGPLQKPHPLQYTGEAFLQQFHIDIITQFVSAGLQLPFWMYCSIHSIKPNELNINHAGSWFPLFQASYSIPRHPTDKNRLLSASLLAASDLWSCPSEVTSIEIMLEKNAMAAIGTLCYMPESIPKLNSVSIKKFLHEYPQLISALTNDGNEASTKYNASVYQLLMGSSPFDIRRLFGWQSTNTFAGEDSPKVLPHFSEPHLSALHSRHQKLSFPYYLKHGRPVYAFLSFLSEELDRSEASLSQKRIHQACGAALWIACQNFNTPSITSACVIFVELLGQDSAHVRTMLNVGRILLTHKHKCVGGSAESRQEQLKSVVSDIVSDLLACVRSSQRYGNKLVKGLEAAIEEEIKLEVIGRCSYDAALKWMIVLMLCEHLSLPLSTCFLKACAETDNWLMFVWFSQLHQYPAPQLQNLLQSFRSTNLRDHLHYVINNADSKWFSTATSSSNNRHVSTEKKSSVTQRSFLYSKIGLQKTKDRASTSSDDEEEKLGKTGISSFSSRLKQSEFNDCEMQESTAPDDVFRMLFYCQSMPSRWRCLLSASIALRNPLFAELAACCGCPAVPSVCGWLLSSLSSEAQQTFFNKHGQNVSKWKLEQLQALFDSVLQQGLEDSLATAFIILQPLSPLLPLFCFIVEFVKRQNYSACKAYIDQFKEAIGTFESRKSSEKSSETDLLTFGDRVWFEKVTYQVLKYELKVISSLYQAKHLLEILDKTNMCLVFSFDVLDFSLLHKIVLILHANLVPCPHLGAFLTSGKSDKFISECEESVNYLISCGKFSEAHELAKMAGISREGVTISQLKEEKERLVLCGMWTAKYVRIQYWNKCKTLLLQAVCSTGTCSHFYQTELQGTSIEFEKALLCQHWLMVMAGVTEPEVVTLKETVFRNMWRHRIAAKMSLEEQEPLDHIFENVDVTSKKLGDLKTDLVQLCAVTHYGSDIQGDLNSQELEVLDTLMGNYLDDGRIGDCTHVAAVFGHYNQDLAIIQTCIALALGLCSVDTIEPAMRRLVAKASAQRTRHVSLTLHRSFSVSSISSGTSTLTDISLAYESSDIINVMEKLYTHCIKGSRVCLRIIACFKISQVLGVDYKQIVTNSEFESLRQLLNIDYPNKFIIARDFLTTSGLSEDEITGFLSDSIVDVLKTLVQKESDSLSELGSGANKADKAFNPLDGMEVFGQFMKLTENTALLGNRILQAVATLLPCEHEEMSSTVLTIQTELIIMAHESYTISSNMEGISHVLRAARVCCDCLAASSEFNLMIRLLTGVGRYSEMQYIFHALQQNHQFELLLRKGMDREDKLKVAILDYLKRYQPDDSEAYTMVALKFTMYRDIAAMLESCGHKCMNQLKDKPLENSKEIQEQLKKCLQYFQDAAGSYIKDSSIRKAQHCVRLARLLSLQLQFLPSGIQVVELNKDQVTQFINTHNRFIEAMVVCDAYEKHADWVEAVYNNVILNGDIRYLQEMKLHVHITPALVEDVIKRYKQLPTKSSSTMQPIKKLLSLCKDVQMQYRLASELGLGDVVTSLLKGDTGSFLQDVTLI